MKYQEEYFTEEVKDGFKVSSLMKRCWAAQIEVLEQFDSICKRLGIKYYAAYGTLLGAVRSGGFIPWDDDIDIWMFREDVNILIEKGMSIIKDEGLEFISAFIDPLYNNMVMRINNTRVFSLEEEFLMKYHLFPFTAGLDIFPLDYVPDNEEKMCYLKRMIGNAVALAKKWDDTTVLQNDKWSMYKWLCSELGEECREKEAIPKHIWKMIDSFCGMYSAKDTNRIAMLTYFFEDENKVFLKEWFGKPVYLEFEGVNIPCPSDYNKVLTAEFGNDYMTPKKTSSDHDYPYYRSRQELLIKFLESKGIPCPSFYNIEL